jgi:2-dehydropantoate 2-reductase
VVVDRKRGIGIAQGHPLVPALVEVFNAAGLNARLYNSAQGMKWSKMITNLLANATSAILDMTPLEVFNNPDLCHLEILQIQETLRVMKAMKVPVVDLPGTPVRSLVAGIRLLPEFLSRPLLARALGSARGAKMPSFHIDLYAQRGKSEVDFLNGAVVRFGDRYEVPTPVNRALTWVLSGLTHRELAIQDFAHRPEALLSVVAQTSKQA